MCHLVRPSTPIPSPVIYTTLEPKKLGKLLLDILCLSSLEGETEGGGTRNRRETNHAEKNGEGGKQTSVTELNLPWDGCLFVH